ncbi:hypothetical protein [Zhihengliuella halotolerans]|uniref:hypothetical protein n=1 Tax=Zhihengliuella halotolerans TaxID=370736 RepID=UPI0011AFAFE0|nr:hypothetical protein [Zhihengliuella halotolerans]
MPGYQYGAVSNTPAGLRRRITALESEVARKTRTIRELDSQIRELNNENARLRELNTGERPIEHGTSNGYSRHYDRGEKPCEECRVAYLARRRELQQQRKKAQK